MRGHVSVFHATKEIEPGYFKSQGLRLLDLTEHWNWVVDVVNARIPQMARRFAAARSFWEDPFYADQRSCREGRLFVTFTMSGMAADASGIWRLVSFFGGEAIYWPLHEEDEWQDCVDVLRNLGDPVIVEAAIPACDVSTYGDDAFAKTILSRCAQRHNARFNAFDSEGIVLRALRPHEIVAAHDARRVCPDAFD